MAIKEIEEREGCFAKALPDEPMFVLLARDRQAPDLVWQWAQTRLDQLRDGLRSMDDLPQVMEAFACAAAMKKWREANDGKWRGEAGIEKQIARLTPAERAILFTITSHGAVSTHFIALSTGRIADRGVAQECLALVDKGLVTRHHAPAVSWALAERVEAHRDTILELLAQADQP